MKVKEHNKNITSIEVIFLLLEAGDIKNKK